MKHLLKLEDWSTDEIINTLNLADQLKYEQKHGIEHKILAGKTLGMIFEKSSTRTRVSFEVGMTQLGGYPLFLSSNDLQIGRGEPVQDTARVLSRFLDGIMIRTFKQEEVEALAEYGSIPIINGLTDYCHPCQVLADLMTIREFKGKLEGLKMCFIGDGNNMMNSLIVGALSTGMSFSAACPKGYMPPEHIIEFGKKYGNGKFEIVEDPMEAAKNAGARDMIVLNEALAAAIGAGLPVSDPVGNMVVDIGGGTTDSAVVVLGGIACHKSVRTGGTYIDKAIVEYIARRSKPSIGERTAEQIKLTLGSALMGGDEHMEVRGRSMIPGCPKA